MDNLPRTEMLEADLLAVEEDLAIRLARIADLEAEVKVRDRHIANLSESLRETCVQICQGKAENARLITQLAEALNKAKAQMVEPEPVWNRQDGVMVIAGKPEPEPAKPEVGRYPWQRFSA